MKRFAIAVLAATLLAVTAAAPAPAADPYEIDGILPLTGNIAFVGQTELQAIKAVEAYVNRTGGINGRPISFNILDDQNDPKTSVLLTQSLIAKNVPVIFGPSSPQSCAAVLPLIKNGPVQYCIAQAGSPPVGSYQFYTHPYDPTFAVTWRFFRERGWHKVAYLVSTDGGGQDAERTILAGAALPENKDMQIVAREHFAPQDLSVSAQLARIKATSPDVLIAWGTGRSFARSAMPGWTCRRIRLPVTSPRASSSSTARSFPPPACTSRPCRIMRATRTAVRRVTQSP
jgi:branched-chain amino acid transport system substrate-binding protein